MAITISGQNNNDKILASDGVLDQISGFNVVGVMTATTFNVTTKHTANHIDVGSTIQLGNAGIITATTLIGNVTGNVNSTSNLLLQISGSEKFRVGNGGQFGIAGANYGTAGQVFTSGGSGSAPTWSTINSDKITEGNTEAEVVDTGSDGHFKVTTEGSERLRVDSSGRVMIGTTTEGYDTGDNLTIASNGHTGITIRSGTSAGGNIFFSDGTSGADEYRGNVSYDHTNNFMRFYVNAAERLRITSDGRMLLGTTTPGNSTADDLTIATSSNTGITLRSATNGEGNIFFGDGTSGADQYRGMVRYYHNDDALAFHAAGSERLRIASNGQVSISSDGTTDGLLTIKGDTDQVGTPSIRLLDGSDTREVSISNTSGDFVVSVHGNDNAIHGHIKMFESGIIDFNNGGASGSNVNRLRIDTSGHMGLGVLPNTNWPTNNDFKALQIGTGACVFGRGSGDEDRGGIAVNWYTDGSNNKYLGNGNAARIYLADGNIYFANAGANSSGANAAMTLNDKMILSSSGRLGIAGFQHNYTMNSSSTDLVIGDGGGGRGITIWTAAAADNQTISFQTNETLSRAEGEISYGPTNTSTAADRNAMMFRTNSSERLRITSNGQIQQLATGGDNQFVTKRTSAAGSNGDYYFHLFANNNSGTNMGALGIVRDTGNDNSRMMFYTANSGTNKERARINRWGGLQLRNIQPPYGSSEPASRYVYSFHRSGTYNTFWVEIRFAQPGSYCLDLRMGGYSNRHMHYTFQGYVYAGNDFASAAAIDSGNGPQRYYSNQGAYNTYGTIIRFGFSSMSATHPVVHYELSYGAAGGDHLAEVTNMLWS